MRGIYHSPYRTADPTALAQALVETRQDTLALIEAWSHALPDLQVPQDVGLNPPLWEWGHLAWFQEWWTVRNQERYLGIHSASSGLGFGPSILPQADALYDSSRVAHHTRWSLDLPNLHSTRNYMQRVLDRSLEHLLAINNYDDNALYFWRLALFHEAMHNEASLYMAQALGLGVGVPPHHRRATLTLQKTPTSVNGTIQISSQTLHQGYAGQGFAFDNELANHQVAVDGFEIDTQAIIWSQYLDFVQATQYPLPPYVRHHQNHWQLLRLGQWQPLDLSTTVSHVSATDAQAWCEWAGRRLPTEAEWNCAVAHPDFEWGEVWEWTSSPFAPFDGFEPHPYQDYSTPWWHSHRVLKGASWATPDCLVDTRFRNFFVPNRQDIVCGFRTVAL